jgi:hypothetical protein
MTNLVFRQKTSKSVWAAVFLLWLLFAQMTRGAVISSVTFDEGPHLAVGYATLRTSDFRLQPVHIHPPLANMLAAAPLLLDPSLPDPRTIPGWEIASLSAVTDTVVWKHQPQDGIALAGRLPIILLAMLLGACVYRWAADLAGWKAGLLALFLYTLDPNIIAHGQVITTDTAVTAFGFISFYCLYKSLVSTLEHQKWWLIGTGLALGAALAAKVSAGLIAPLIAVIVLLAWRGTFARRIGQVAVIGLVAFAIVWAVYGFQIDRVPGLPIPVPAATHWKIYQALQAHYDEGHPSFLLGMNSTHGWWYYFPVAFLIKTPLPTLILLVVSLVLVCRSQTADRRPPIGYWTLGLFPIVHFATALWSSVDIGYRHLLPILPFLFVLIAWQVAGRGALGARHTSPAAGLTLSPRHLVTLSLLVWTIVNAICIFPHNLAFFNELAGGPDNGYRWLVDSNLDWGQNLKELKAWLDARGVSQVSISQFSPARPEVYGIQATMLPPSPRAAPFAPYDPAPGWYAIGATTLQGAYTPDVNTFAWFRTHEPVTRLGHALFIYEVKPRQPDVSWAAVCADPAPLLSTEETRADFGQKDIRVTVINCRQSWIYPASSGAGGYILPHGVQAPQIGRASCRERVYSYV